MLPIQAKSAGSFLRLCRRIDLQCAFFHKNFRRATSETFYDVLGVPNDATDKEIRKAYFDLSKKFHPDSNPNDKSLHDKFVKVNDAYKVLSKPSERKIYDENLKAGLHMGADEVSTTQNWNPNHPQYYYHPKFYKDPRMRKEAAKAWSQHYGAFYFKKYMEDDFRDPSESPPEITPSQRMYMRITGIMLVLIVFMVIAQIRKDGKRSKEENFKGYYEKAVTDPKSGKTWNVKYAHKPPEPGVRVTPIGDDSQFNIKDSDAEKLPINKF